MRALSKAASTRPELSVINPRVTSCSSREATSMLNGSDCGGAFPATTGHTIASNIVSAASSARHLFMAMIVIKARAEQERAQHGPPDRRHAQDPAADPFPCYDTSPSAIMRRSPLNNQRRNQPFPAVRADRGQILRRAGPNPIQHLERRTLCLRESWNAR